MSATSDGWGPAVVAVRDARREREREADRRTAEFLRSREFHAAATYALGRLLLWLAETDMAVMEQAG